MPILSPSIDPAAVAQLPFAVAFLDASRRLVASSKPFDELGAPIAADLESALDEAVATGATYVAPTVVGPGRVAQASVHPWHRALANSRAADFAALLLTEPCGEATAERDTILEALDVGLMIVDADATLTVRNRTAADLLALPTARTTFHDWAASYRLMTASGAPLFIDEDPFWRTLFGEAVPEAIYRLRSDVRGLDRWVSVSSRRLTPSKLPMLLRLKDATAEIRRDEAVDRALRDGAHDLLESARAMMTGLEIAAQQAPGSPPGPTFSQRGLQAGRRLRQQIRDLSSYGRWLVRTPEWQWVEWASIWDAVEADLRPSIEAAQAEVRHNLVGQVRADAKALQRLLRNLVDNAIKFRDPNRPASVEIAVERISNEWQVRVTDLGIGIRPEHQDQIFTALGRLHSHRTYPGTGVGLAECKRIVEQHHGTLGVQSEAGQGSTFWFRLPV